MNMFGIKKALEKIITDKTITFADNMKEPVHRWFRFPAGFSSKMVKGTMEAIGIERGHVVLDPFTGCGTTNVVAKRLNIDSIGVELHPLLAWIAEVKTYWDFDLGSLKTKLEETLDNAENNINKEWYYDLDNLPKLLRKCYSDVVLRELYAIKESIELVSDENLKRFLTLGLLSTLRKVTYANVGWPYILPKRRKKKSVQGTLEAFKKQILMMYDDLKKITENGSITAEVKIHKADTRKMDFMDDESVDFAFTSPPYLNNYDYADRTRLELYFLGWASSWKEISEKIRKKLIVSCSHQAKEMGLDEGLVPIKEMDEKLKKKLISISENLKKIKHTRGGKKDYDIMTIGYFNDMFRSMEEIYRVLNDGAYFCMILGDSAPYGIYIPTDIYLSKIGKSIGFRESKIYELRKRGGKWQYLVDKGIRHNVKLRESMIIFQK